MNYAPKSCNHACGGARHHLNHSNPVCSIGTPNVLKVTMFSSRLGSRYSPLPHSHAGMRARERHHDCGSNPTARKRVAPRPLSRRSPRVAGLDSSNAAAVVGILARLGARGVTVLLSIHQPRPDILRLMDRTLILSAVGEIVYSGAVKTLKGLQ